MKILIVDDIRTPETIFLTDATLALYEDVEWDLAVNYFEAILKLSENEYDVVTLDHDLGEEKTGYDVANWLENEVVEGMYVPPVIRVHSSNPVGVTRINQVIASIKRFRNDRS